MCHDISRVRSSRAIPNISRFNQNRLYLLENTYSRLVTVAKVMEQGGVPKEKRGSDREPKKSALRKENVRQFIDNLKGKESHYSRKKFKRISLPQPFL